MKILRLDLKAFGPFSDVALDLSAGREGLHIIFGANEAGKSTALRGLQHLFFGIPDRGGDFLHQGPQLRLGARIRNRAGVMLDFWRRRSRKNALYAADDATPLEAEALQPFLGGLDRELFASMFALDRGTLEKGGQEILQGGGQLGKILFAAGSGISDLQKVQDSLEVEYTELFKSLGKNQKIPRALTELRDVRERIKDLQLSSDAWLEHDKALRQAQDRRKQLQDAIDKLTNERTRLLRFRDALPLLARRKEILAEVEPEQEVISLAEIVAGTSRRTMGKSGTVLLHRAAVVSPEKLTAQAEAIEDLYRRLGEYQKASQELPGVAEKWQSRDTQARQMWQTLGRLGDLPNRFGLGLDEAAEFRELAQKFQELDLQRQHARAEREKAMTLLQDVRDSLANIAVPVDVAELKQALRQAQQQIPSEAERQRLTEEADRLHNEITTQWLNVAGFARIQPNSTTCEKLTSLLPLPETVDKLRDDLFHAENQVRSLDNQVKDAEAGVRLARSRFEQLGIQGDLPAFPDLHLARQLRDQTWQRLLEAWRQGTPADNELTRAFADSILQADQIADRLRDLTALQATHAELFAQVQQRQQRLQTLADERDLERNRLTSLQQAWLSAWQPSGIQPQSPAAMKGWLNQVQALAQKTRDERNLREKADGLVQRLQRQSTALEACLAKFQVPATPLFSSLGLLIEQAQEQLDKHQELERRRADLERELTRNQAIATQAESTLARCDQEMQPWQQRWTEMMKRLDLVPTTSVAVAQQHVETLQQLSLLLQEREQSRQRHADLERATSEFAHDVALLREQLFPGKDWDPARAAGEMYRSLQVNRELAQIDNHVRNLAGDTPFEDFAAAVEEVAPGRLKEDLARAEQQLRDLGKQLQEADQTVGMRRKTLTDMDGSAAAAEAAEQAELLTAQIHSDAHDYLALRLAAGILQESIERYRQKNEGPVVRRASDLFAILTTGSFEGLDLDTNDKGEPVLSGLRAGERQTVLVEQMSDGTRDQLYLALRLASLEVYLKSHEPIPVILDDLLLNFDDQRAIAALHILADLAGQTQILFFTHHQHLVHLAQQNLPDERVFFHNLRVRA